MLLIDQTYNWGLICYYGHTYTRILMAHEWDLPSANHPPHKTRQAITYLEAPELDLLVTLDLVEALDVARDLVARVVEALGDKALSA